MIVICFGVSYFGCVCRCVGLTWLVWLFADSFGFIVSLLWLLVTGLVWLLCCFMGLGVGYFVSLVMFAMFCLVG